MKTLKPIHFLPFIGTYYANGTRLHEKVFLMLYNLVIFLISMNIATYYYLL